MSTPVPGRPQGTSGVPGLARFLPARAPAAGVLLGWIVLLLLVPLVVGLAVGAHPLRLISSGIMFEQLEVTINGYRLLIWSPVVGGILLGALALLRRPNPFLVTLGLIGTTMAATLLVLGGGLGIGPGTTLLVGTELRWVWKLCIIAGGLALGLTGPLLIKTLAEDFELDVRGIKRDLLLTAAVLGVLILLFAPGPLLGKVMTGMGSWLGSLVWLLAL